MLSRVILPLALFSLLEAANFDGKKLEGNIILPNEVKSIPEGSCMKVSLEDATKQDTASKTLAKKVIKTPELSYEEGKPISYSLDLKGELNEALDYSMSVVINLAWCAEEGGKEWIRKGDLINDTNFPVKLQDCIKASQDVCKGPLVSIIKS